MKLNLDELVVTSFSTDGSAPGTLPTVGTNDPTPQTHCDDCLSPTIKGCW